MASIQADMPFHLIGGSLDDKQNFKTLEEMKNCPEDSLGKTAMCTNDEDGKIYVFNINNEVDSIFGKWRSLFSEVGDGSITKVKLANEVIDTTIQKLGLEDINREDLWEIGEYSNSNGKPIENTSSIRTKDFISTSVKFAFNTNNSKYAIAIRIYSITTGAYIGSGKYKADYEFDHKTKKYKIAIKLNGTNPITISEYSVLQLKGINAKEGVINYDESHDALEVNTKNGWTGIVKSETPINPNDEKWAIDMYKYGFDINKARAYNCIKSPLSVDGTISSVCGPNSRWRENFPHGGHVFEGWSSDYKHRITMLCLEANGQDKLQISALDDYDYDSLTFGWVKIGSDTNYNDLTGGTDFTSTHVKFHTPISFDKRPEPKNMPGRDKDTNELIPIRDGSLYLDEVDGRLKLKVDGVWRTLAFVDENTKYDDTAWVSTGLGMITDNEKITINGISLKRVGDTVAFRIHGFMKTECSNTTVTDIITNIPDKYKPNSSVSIPVLGHGTGDNVGIYVDEITFTSNGTLNLSLQGTPKNEYFSWEGHYHISI